MRKVYEKPMAYEETFMANEYVATCWKVACQNNTTYSNRTSNAPYGNHWHKEEGPYDRPFAHGGDCYNVEKNYFQANGTNITFEFERNKDQGDLSGGFDYWEDVNNNNIVDENDVIYWNTDNGSRVWNHWGYVKSVDKAHINRS